jgi:hypothetical protein
VQREEKGWLEMKVGDTEQKMTSEAGVHMSQSLRRGRPGVQGPAWAT